ncbi:hypothetical protein LTR64_000707 [Lithohypha guttulata]|uniref:uncharacterized protein n=1 Tax=Lithohypha guttulata TaxID=1690604 RepID=UPI002DDDF88F|nr:hypothetical protein LTR51_005524 [Lithohypha guttulata]
MSGHKFTELIGQDSSSIQAGDRYANNYINSSGPVVLLNNETQTFEQVQQLTQQLRELRAELICPPVANQTPLSHGAGSKDAIEKNLNQELHVYKPEIDVTKANPNVLQSLSAHSDVPTQQISKAAPVFLVPYSRNTRFIDRPAESAALSEYFFVNNLTEGATKGELQRQRRVALYGLGGAGKTQLAIYFAYIYRSYYADHSVFWVHASTEEWLRQSFQSIASECGIDVNQKGASNVFTTVGAWLKKSSGPWLMILDNADDADVLFCKRRRLADMLAECAHGSIIATTRNKRVAEKVTMYGTTIAVNQMSESQSVQLMNSFLATDQQYNRRNSHNYNNIDIKSLAQSLGYLPLALAQAAAYIRENSISPSDYLKMWTTSTENAQTLLNTEFEADGRQYYDTDVPNAVGTTMMLSLDYLRERKPRAGEILVLLSFLHYTNIDPAMLLLPWETISDPSFIEALGDLQAFSLLEKGADNSTYTMHRLLHHVTCRWRTLRLSFEQLRKAVTVALKQLARCSSFRSGKTDRGMSDLQLPHLLRFFQEESRLGIASEALEKVHLMRRVAEHLLYQGRVLESTEMRASILQLTETFSEHLLIEAVRSKCEYAETLEQLHRFKEAQELCQEVVDILESTQSRRQTYINALRIMSRIFAKRGMFDEALLKARAAKEAAIAFLGTTHADTLVMDFNIVEVMRLSAAHAGTNREQLVEAKNVLNGTVTQLSILKGENDPLTILGKQHLVNVLDDLQEFDASVAISEDIVTSKEKSLGSQHLETFQAKLGLALCFMKRSQYLEAERIILKVLDCTAPTVNAHHLGRPKALQMLATIHEKRAQQWRERSKLAELSKDGEPERQSTGKSRAGPGTAVLSPPSKDFDFEKAALDAYTTALRLKIEASLYLEAAPGIEHPYTLEHIIDTSRTCMQLFLTKSGEYSNSIDNAERMQRDVLGVQQDVFGKDHEDTMTTKGLLVVTLYEKLSQEDTKDATTSKSEKSNSTAAQKREVDRNKLVGEAESLALEVYRHRIKRHGKLHRDTLGMQQILAEIMYKQPKAQNAAIKLIYKCHQSSVTAFGDEDEETKNRLEMCLAWKVVNDSLATPSTHTSTWRMLENDYNMRRPVAYNTMKSTAPISAPISSRSRVPDLNEVLNNVSSTPYIGIACPPTPYQTLRVVRGFHPAKD